MRVHAHVAGLFLSGSVLAGCATHAEPLTPAGTPALNAPEPPGRYVLPATEQPTLPPQVEDPPAGSGAPVTAKPPVRPNPRPASPPPAEPPPPTPTPTPTPAILSTPASADFEQRIEKQLSLAQSDLDQVKRPLGTDAQAQFNAAQGFIRQAREALKVKNLIYAGQLADKAATMAALLRK